MANDPIDGKTLEILDAIKLCLSCGICCTGMLFTYAPLKQHEIEFVTNAGLEEYTKPEDADGRAFKLPCVRWDEKCTIYPNRPDICESYRCHLLRRLDSGNVSLDQALEIVRRAKSLVEAITLQLDEKNIDRPLWDGISEFKKLNSIRGSSLDFNNNENADLLLTVGMLLATLKEFEPNNYIQDLPGGPETTTETQSE